MPSRQINEFSQKGNRKKIQLVVRPGAQSQQVYQHLHPGLLMEEDDPVLMSSNKDPTEDPADDALMALEGSDFETSGCGTSVQFSLDDLASFAHPFGSHTVCRLLH